MANLVVGPLHRGVMPPLKSRRVGKYMALFARFGKNKEKPGFAPHVPLGDLVYAIGDIHGRDDLFARLLAQIDADLAGQRYDRCTLVLLGDLVDRGPDSDRVVDRAMGLADGFDKFHCLTRNHEECMLAALTGDVRMLRYFFRIGGDATIRSYLRDDQRMAKLSFEELADAFVAAVTQSHVDLLGCGEDMMLIGDYAFVHTGVRQNVALEKQATSDLRWIREEFLRSDHDFGAVVVHGHSISDEIQHRSNWIGIDTGAYMSGRLSALVLKAVESRALAK